MSQRRGPDPRSRAQELAKFQDIYRSQMSIPDNIQGYNRYGMSGQPYSAYGDGGGDFSQQTMGGASTIATGVELGPTTPIKPDAGIIDTYIYCDSVYKDPGSDLQNGRLVFDIAALNNNQPVDNVIEMEISSFFIPVVDNFPLDMPIPQTFFYRRNTLLIQELTTQAYFGPNQNRFHWEVDVSPQGIANQVTPVKPKFIFGRPVRDITKITLVIKTPVNPLSLPVDVYPSVAIPGSGTSASNPLQFQTGFPSAIPNGLNNSDFIAPPATALTAVNVGDPAGLLSAGNYQYIVTYVTDAGETNGGVASAVVVAAAPSYNNLTNIPIGPPGVIARKIYRTAAGGPSYKLVMYVNDNLTTSLTGIDFADNIPDAGLTTPLATANTTGGTQYTVYITGFNSSGLGIPTNLDGVVNRAQGHLVTVTGPSTIALSNTPQAVIPGGIPAGPPFLQAQIVIAYRRVAIPIRFRQLANGDTNRIMPV